MGWKEDQERILALRSGQDTVDRRCTWCSTKIAAGEAKLCPLCRVEADVEDAETDDRLIAEESTSVLAGCCTESRPCVEHLDAVFEGHRTDQEDRYLEHGGLRGAA
jgi:hypothetical protein